MHFSPHPAARMSVWDDLDDLSELQVLSLLSFRDCVRINPFGTRGVAQE